MVIIEITIKDFLARRILSDFDTEEFILKNYSTDKLKQAKMYVDLIKEINKKLFNRDNDAIELFNTIKEDDFNNKIMRFLDVIEMFINRNVGPIYQEVYFKNIVVREPTFKVEFEVIK